MKGIWMTALALAVLGIQGFTDEEIENLFGGQPSHKITKEDISEIKKQQDQKFIADLKKFYRADAEAVISVDDLEHLIRQSILTRDQAQRMWEMLIKKAEESYGRVSSQGFYLAEDQLILGILPITSLFYSIGSYVFLTFIIALCVSSYNQNTPVGLLFSSAVLGFISYLGGYSLHVSQGSGLISSCLFLATTSGCIMFTHAVFSLIGISSLKVRSADLLPVQNLEFKVLLCSVGMAVSYYLSFQCNFPLVQLPFYGGMTYLVCLVGLHLHSYMPLHCQPFWILLLLVYSVGLMVYLHCSGSQAFLLAAVTEVLKTKKPVDFRLMGYLTSLLFGITSLPVMIYVNYHKEHDLFESNYFTSEFIDQRLNKGKKDTKCVFRDWQLKDLWIVLYMLIQVALIAYGFYMKIWAVCLAGHTGLSISILFLPKTKSYFPDFILFPLFYTPVILTPFALGFLEDSFSHFVASFLDNSYFWTFCTTMLRFGSTFIAWFSVGSSHLLSAKESELPQSSDQGHKDPEFTVTDSIVNFFVRYLITLVLISLAEQEDSWVISIFYNFVVVIINYQPILFATSAETDLENLVLSVVVLLLGMRISLLSSSSTWLFSFLGIAMMIVAIYRTYQVGKHNFILYLLCLVYCLAFVVHSVCLKNFWVLVIALFSLFVVVAKKLNQNNWKLMVLVFTLGTLLYYTQYSMDSRSLFEAIEHQITESDHLSSIFKTMLDTESFIPEKAFINESLKELQNFISKLNLK